MSKKKESTLVVTRAYKEELGEEFAIVTRLRYDWEHGSDLSEAVKMFGEEVVFDFFKRAVIARIHGLMSYMYKSGRSRQEVESFMRSNFTPSINLRDFRRTGAFEDFEEDYS